jgi:hypothetical protein
MANLVMNWKDNRASPFRGVQIKLFNHYQNRYDRFRVHFDFDGHHEKWKGIRFRDGGYGLNLNETRKHVRLWTERNRDEILKAYDAFERRVLDMRGPGAFKLLNEKTVLLAKIAQNDARFAVREAEYHRQWDDAREGRRTKSVVTGCWQERSMELVGYGSSVTTRFGRVSSPDRYRDRVETKYSSQQVPDYPDRLVRYDDNNELHARIREIDVELKKYGML